MMVCWGIELKGHEVQLNKNLCQEVDSENGK